jgi:hypothetical protein
MSKVVSRSCLSASVAGGGSVPAFVAIASSLPIYSRKAIFRVHYYASPFGDKAHPPVTNLNGEMTIKLHSVGMIEAFFAKESMKIKPNSMGGQSSEITHPQTQQL